MKPSRFGILIVSTFIFVFCAVSPATPTISTRWDVPYFQGVDTIQVGWRLETGAKLFPFKARTILDENDPIVATVKDIFADQKWLTVTHNLPVKERGQNVVYLEFIVSGREETNEEKKVKMGAISFHFWKMPSSPQEQINSAFIAPTPYPFMIPESKQRLDQEFARGVHFLIDQFSESFECARDRSACNPRK